MHTEMSTIVALLPDARYSVRRKYLDPAETHVTLACYGDLDPTSPQVVALRWITKRLAEDLARFPERHAMVSGQGLFDISNSSVRSWAIVDLIDGWFVYKARTILEEMSHNVGVQIDRAHGFTPHVTTEYTNDTNERIRCADVQSFKVGFHSLAVWSRDQRWEFDI